MNRPASLLLLLAMLASLAACNAEESPDGARADGGGAVTTDAAGLRSLPDDESLLFALQADSGELEAVEGSAGLAYTLTLGHAARQTTWFADRPARDGGTVPTEAFVAGWASLGFEDVPPNAVLTRAGREDDAPLIVELGTPTYQRDERTMRVPVHVLARTERDGIAGRFGAASLFIDNATITSGCGYTGEIDYFPESVTPAGYVPADGRSVSTADLPELYAVVGDRFGSGAEWFRVPTVPGPGPGLQALVCAAGADPAETDPDEQAANSCVIGRVQLFAQETPVYGYLLANGRELPITRHSWLFGYAGDRFGGDGVTTFGLPTISSPAGTSQQVCASNFNNWTINDNAGECYMSEVGYWAVARAGMPLNWRATQSNGLSGLLISVAQNTALYELLGVAFGGDGRRTFALPFLDLPDENLTPGLCARGQFPPRA